MSEAKDELEARLIPGRPSPWGADFLLYADDRVLLQHRDDRPAIRWPGYWCIFGGLIEPGESPEQAVVREIEEELGVALPAVPELFCVVTEGLRERYVFRAPLPVAVEALVLREGQGMALVALEELDRLPLVPEDRAILEAYFRAC
jgi:8-oxo-dGTP diphosphatase